MESFAGRGTDPGLWGGTSMALFVRTQYQERKAEIDAYNEISEED